MAAHGGSIYYDTKSTGARFVVRIPRGADGPDTGPKNGNDPTLNG